MLYVAFNNGTFLLSPLPSPPLSHFLLPPPPFHLPPRSYHPMTEKSSSLSLDGCGKSLFARVVVVAGLSYLSLDCVCAVVEWEAGGSHPVDTVQLINIFTERGRKGQEWMRGGDREWEWVRKVRWGEWGRWGEVLCRRS